MIKKIVIALLVSTCVLTGCKAEEIASTLSAFDDYSGRFVIVSSEHGSSGMIVYDSTTGVQYWMSTSAYNSGTLTLLVDSEGKPLIYKGE